MSDLWTPATLVVVVAAIGSALVGIVGAIFKGLADIRAKQVEIAAHVQQVEHATNSMKDALVKETGDAARAQGIAEGVALAARTAADIKALAVLVAEQVVRTAEEVASAKLSKERTP